jgi:hypothetical protein
MLQPESGGLVLQTCQTGTHAICAVDLLANTQGKTASPHFISASRLLRSSTDSSPLITALRV